ncbi:hypothetical protein [Pseudonocardia dioxanivorans]|uniref:hypothetical protein n=1 Tax=Pseudonocardia dioxanivorans TaxID=240495 RepID=UPI000CD00B78|nr:hypothetical protein [Pseudonocardia dioxanivorans]
MTGPASSADDASAAPGGRGVPSVADMAVLAGVHGPKVPSTAVRQRVAGDGRPVVDGLRPREALRDDPGDGREVDMRYVAQASRQETVRVTRWSLVVVEALVALAAVYGGVGLMADNMIGMPHDWLSATPFTSWVVPGMLLVLVVAVPMTVAAVLEARRSTWAPVVSIAAGGALVAWIGVQLLVVQRYNVLQPVMLGIGLAVFLLAVVLHRHEPPTALRR